MDDDEEDEDDEGADSDLDDEAYEEDDSEESSADGSAIFATSASFDGSKGMDLNNQSSSNNDSQNSVDLGVQTGNPIVIILLSLLFLLIIPLRNR